MLRLGENYRWPATGDGAWRPAGRPAVYLDHGGVQSGAIENACVAELNEG